MVFRQLLMQDRGILEISLIEIRLSYKAYFEMFFLHRGESVHWQKRHSSADRSVWRIVRFEMSKISGMNKELIGDSEDYLK